MDIIRLWAEPAVHDLGFAARAAVHTGIWTLWLLLLQYAIFALVGVLRMAHLQPYTPAPKYSWHRMLAESAVGIFGWTWPLGVLAAWLNPGAAGGWQWDYSCPNLLLLGYYATACLMLYNAYSYPVHKWMHENKTAFRLMHMKHHDMKAALDTTSSSYMAVTEGFFSEGLPMVALYLLGLSTGNWWYTLAGLWNSLHLLIVGHCGADVTMNDWREVALLLLNPMGFWFITCPARGSPNNHADHHMNPRRNYAFLFSYWDDLYGTASSHSKPPCSLLVLTAHGVWQLLLFSTIYTFITHPMPAAAAFVTCYVLVPLPAAVTVANWLRLPHFTRAVFRRLMDQYRADNYITYADAGTPGAFTSCAAAPAQEAVSAAATDNSDVQGVAKRVPTDASIRGKDQHQKEPVYIFACRPAGLLSRAAFCTFAARGWHSPVSALRDVRLAVGRILFLLPLPCLREFLLACGCIPADKHSMRSALRSGCSVAVTPGGWREGRYSGSYKLVLKHRKGFIQLAQDTGAVLVPVLCLGEQDLALLPDHSASVPLFLWVYRLVQVYRPHPIKVVYGEPVTPQRGESPAKLHSRYVHALMELGRQHKVDLELAE